MLALEGLLQAGGVRTKIASALFFIALASASSAQSSKAMSVMVLSTSHELFYFKVSKEMLQGTVEVYNAQQQLIGRQLLDKRKMMIDFFDAAPGNYTIKVVAANQSFEYTYQKESSVAQLKISALPTAAVGNQP
jgi:hypothetical protein